MGTGESPLVCKKKQRRKHRLGAVAPKLAVLRTGWAHTSQKFAWATCVLRQFRTLSAKQKISSLLFMLKSNKNLEPVSLWVPNLRRRGKGHKVSLSKPFPTDPKGYGEKRRRCACNLSSKVEVLLSNPIYDSDFFRLISEIRVKNILLFSMDFFQPIHLKKYPK